MRPGAGGGRGDNPSGRIPPGGPYHPPQLLLLAVLIGVVGCQGAGPFAGKKRNDRPPPTCPDPLLSPDLEEQQNWARSRFAYPEDDRNIAPPTYADRPTPSGR